VKRALSPFAAALSFAFFAFFALVLGIVLAMGCRGNAQREREEAHAVTRAWQEFQRNEATADRSAIVAAMKALPCDSPTLCADRDACIVYATAVMRATDLTRRARALAPEDAGGNGAATQEELSIIVSGAEDAVKSAERLERACKEALTRLYTRARR
jgi:hypothetical protein